MASSTTESEKKVVKSDSVPEEVVRTLSIRFDPNAVNNVAPNANEESSSESEYRWRYLFCVRCRSWNTFCAYPECSSCFKVRRAGQTSRCRPRSQKKKTPTEKISQDVASRVEGSMDLDVAALFCVVILMLMNMLGVKLIVRNKLMEN